MSGHGRGIVRMRQRARLVHGKLSVYSEPKQGTEVSVFVPFVNVAS